MTRVLFPEDVRYLKDWNGQKISKFALNQLRIGCVVRCRVRNDTIGHEAWEALYFEIVKIKDGTFWGKTLDIYRLGEDFIGLPSDTIFTFRKNHIMEIPIAWQPSFIRKHLRKYLMNS